MQGLMFFAHYSWFLQQELSVAQEQNPDACSGRLRNIHFDIWSKLVWEHNTLSWLECVQRSSNGKLRIKLVDPLKFKLVRY